jgi:hypothetical protein
MGSRAGVCAPPQARFDPSAATMATKTMATKQQSFPKDGVTPATVSRTG